MPCLLLVRSFGNDHLHEEDDDDTDYEDDIDDGNKGVLGRGGSCLKPFPPCFHAPGSSTS